MERVQQDQADAGGLTNIRHLGYGSQARAAGVMRDACGDLFGGAGVAGEADEGWAAVLCPVLSWPGMGWNGSSEG